MSLQQGSTGSVAAQFSIGATEPHHRHSCVIGLHGSAARHRQDSVRSVVVDLHQVSSAVAELHVQNVALIASLICKSAVSDHALVLRSLRSFSAAWARTSAGVAA